MVQLRREVPDLFYEEFDKANKPINFSKTPKLGWDFSQASLRTHSTQKSAQATSDRYNFSKLSNLLETNRNQRNAGKIVRSLNPNLDWFAPIYDSKPPRALLTRELFALPDSNDSRANQHRICSQWLRLKIHLPVADLHNFNKPEAIIWKNLWRSLIIQTRVDYSMKILAKCKSGLSTTNTTIPSCLMTWTVIDNFLEKFWKAVRTGISLQFSMPKEISTSEDKLLRWHPFPTTQKTQTNEQACQ